MNTFHVSSFEKITTKYTSSLVKSMKLIMKL